MNDFIINSMIHYLYIDNNHLNFLEEYIFIYNLHYDYV